MVKWLLLGLAGLVVIFVVAMAVKRNQATQIQPSGADYVPFVNGLIGGVRKLFTSDSHPAPFYPGDPTDQLISQAQDVGGVLDFLGTI